MVDNSYISPAVWQPTPLPFPDCLSLAFSREKNSYITLSRKEKKIIYLNG
jgi:hypothetical protein